MSTTGSTTRPPRLLQRVRDKIRALHYSYRTEQAYTYWIRYFILFHDKKHPKDMGKSEAERFLTYLGSQKRVSASTQNRALSALLFLYKQVLDLEIGWVEDVVRAKKSTRVPVVLTREEVAAVLQRLNGQYWLMPSLMYGTGMRVMECLRLRVQDVDFGYRQITVHSGKGGKDGFLPLPDPLISALQEQISAAKRIRETDRRDGFGEVSMPEALARKYPNAPFELKWWYVFPSYNRSIDPYSKREKRHHMDPSPIQKAMKQAVHAAGIRKRAP